MIEDASFNAFLKDKLEEGIVVPEVGPVADLAAAPARKVERVAFWPICKVAAAAAVLCGALAWRLMERADSRRERQIAMAIELLESGQTWFDGGEAVAGDRAATVAERLLAWQDAPFAEVANARERGEASAAESAGEGKAPNPAGA